jgi:hypothetical protein
MHTHAFTRVYLKLAHTHSHARTRTRARARARARTRTRTNWSRYAPLDCRIPQGVIFCTYSCLISGRLSAEGTSQSRLQQLVNWCGGDDYDGVLVFDECHKAKNLGSLGGTKSATKAALAVVEIQRRLPNARIVYVSATVANTLSHMGYMERLGLWGSCSLVPPVPPIRSPSHVA